MVQVVLSPRDEGCLKMSSASHLDTYTTVFAQDFRF